MTCNIRTKLADHICNKVKISPPIIFKKIKFRYAACGKYLDSNLLNIRHNRADTYTTTWRSFI